MALKSDTAGSENHGFIAEPQDFQITNSLKRTNFIEVDLDKAGNLDPKFQDPSPVSDQLPAENYQPNILAKCIVTARNILTEFSTKHRSVIKNLLIILSVVLYNAYLIGAIYCSVSNNIPIAWCDGVGLLIVLTGIVYWSILYYFVLKPMLGRRMRGWVKSWSTIWNRLWSKWYAKLTFAVLAVSAILAFLIIDTIEQPRRLISAAGLIVLHLVGLLISKYPGQVKWRQIFWAVGIQFGFGLITLRWEPGRAVLDCISSKVKTFFSFAYVGSDFVYGYLSSGKPTPDMGLPPIFVFRSLSAIFFFGFTISLLYHYGCMQWLIEKLGWILQISIGTTAIESFSAAANIFIGLQEIPLLLLPFLSKMTKSEMHSIVTCGFATIAGTAMATYISFGISPSYLLSAGVMAAPAALGFAKLVYPETEESSTSSKDIKSIQIKSQGSAIDAAAQGAIQGVTLIACIVANIIAFVAFVAFLNAVIGWAGSLVLIQDLSFEYILGKIFVPVTWMIGVDPEECEDVALLLGLKTVANEFIAYQRLLKMKLSPRSTAIATYGLCSFANVGSVGIQVGTMTALAPERRADLASVIGRSFVAGTLVGFLNACIAGTILPEAGYAEWISKSNFTRGI